MASPRSERREKRSRSSIGSIPRRAAVLLSILSLTLVASKCPSPADECYDPVVELPLIAPGAYDGYDPEPDLSGLTLGQYGDRLYFDSESDGTLKVVSSLANHMDRDGGGATVVVGGLRIVVERGQPVTRPPDEEIRDSVTLRAERDIATLDVVRTWTLTEDERGEPRGALSKIALVDSADTQAALDQTGLWLIDNDPTCEELAFTMAGPMPAGMPAVRFPEVDGCTMWQCSKALTAFLLAHHNTWRAHQAMDFIASMPEEQANWVWDRPGRNSDGDMLSEITSPAYWYGDYAEYRFEAIHEVIDKLWKEFETGKNGGITLRLKCPDESEVGNVCFTAEPSAHHAVKGFVNLCSDFFYDNSEWSQARLIPHEYLHHVFVNWNDGIWHLSALMDTHYHGHQAGCGVSPKTEKHYGETKIRHLATYENSYDNDCSHRDKNFRNNDTHAYFITRFGDDILDGDMTQWPAWGDPTPQPPECPDDGVEGCRCLPTVDWGEGENPDGDELAEYCPNDTPDGYNYEITCQKVKFNASANVGVCRACDDVRGAGCACDYQNPCDEGFCWGDDTWGANQGTGQCYPDPPPDFQCLADCNTLYNDDYAWCFHDHPSGEARCVDSNCSHIKEQECFAAETICRDGECVPDGECAGAQDCWDIGYPGIFECVGGRCQYPF